MLDAFQAHSPWPVVVVSPCGALTDPSALDRGVQALLAAGHAVDSPPAVHARHQRFAGEDVVRINALTEALAGPTLLGRAGKAADQQPTVVMASRGGYGASRLLHLVDWQALAQSMGQSCRVLCGHSDVTLIQLALLAAGAPPQGLLHGPMVCFDFGQPQGFDATTYAHFNAATCMRQVDVQWFCPGTQSPAMAPVQLHGPVWGGNLSVLCNLVGTPFWPIVNQGILVLEDVNEPVYKIERMLLQLLHAGVLHKQQAVVLGQFNAPAPVAHDHGYTFEAMAAYLQPLLPCPLLLGFPFGHCTPKACWYQGLPGTLSVQPWFPGDPCGEQTMPGCPAQLLQALA